MGTKDDDRGILAGPGYAGFGGSAGYSGAGGGGIVGGDAGGELSTEPWQPGADTHQDDRIQHDVRERVDLASDVDASQIQVVVEAGIVTLEGHVELRSEKQAAGELAERVPGVRRLHNRLHVGKPLLELLKETLEHAGTKVL